MTKTGKPRLALQGGPQGNSFALIGLGRVILRDHDQDQATVKRFTDEMTAGSRQDLLRCLLEWFDLDISMMPTSDPMAAELWKIRAES